MIKKNLLKTVMLGLCMATLTTGSAYATLAEGTTPSSTEEVSEQTKALFTKQGEIDKILFLETNLQAMEDLGFMVNFTSVVEDYVEIGISPYSDDNANYIYDLVGKDAVKVVEFDQSVIYASGPAPDAATDEVVTDAEVVMDKGDIAEDEVANEDVVVDDKEVQIQIESTTDDANGEEKVYKTTSAEDGEIRTISAPVEEEEESSATPIVVLAIVGGAALVGGAVLLSNKKKASK